LSTHRRYDGFQRGWDALSVHLSIGTPTWRTERGWLESAKPLELVPGDVETSSDCEEKILVAADGYQAMDERRAIKVLLHPDF